MLGIIRERIRPDSIVYSDSFASYDALDISEFHHERINHSEEFVSAGNHINGIPKAHFNLFLKECEWRL